MGRITWREGCVLGGKVEISVVLVGFKWNCLLRRLDEREIKSSEFQGKHSYIDFRLQCG